MAEAVGAVLGYAAGIAVSPLPVIAVVLVLLSGRAKGNGPLFLAGWVVGLTALVAVLHAVAGAIDVGTDATADEGVAWVRLLLGVLLVVAGLRKLRTGASSGGDEELPGWAGRITDLSPAGAVGFGVLLALNPKNLALAVGAVASVAQVASGADAVVGLVAFVLVASAGVIAAVAYALVGGEAAGRGLDRFRAWLTVHQGSVMAAVFLVFGAVLVGQGLGGFG